MGGYRVRLGGDGHSLHVAEVDHDENVGGSSPSSQGDSDVVEVPPGSVLVARYVMTSFQ